jgi:hypothetical protein
MHADSAADLVGMAVRLRLAPAIASLVGALAGILPAMVAEVALGVATANTIVQ